MNNRNIEEARRYHEITKHSYQRARKSTHGLDWDNRSSLYKTYRALPTVVLPRDLQPPQAPTLDAVSRTESDEERSLHFHELTSIRYSVLQRMVQSIES